MEKPDSDEIIKDMEIDKLRDKEMNREELKTWFECELSEMPFEPIFGMVLFSDGFHFGHGKIGNFNHLSEIDKCDLAMQLRKLADGLDGGKASEKFFAEQKRLDNMIEKITT